MKIYFFFISFLLVVLVPSNGRTLEPGEKAPSFQLPSTSGKQVSLSDQAGRLVFIEFWASWCAACKHSLAWLSELQSEYSSQGLKVLAINLDQNPDDLRSFIADQALDFEILLDPQGQVARSYDPSTMPGFYLINQEGELLLAHTGFESQDKLALEKKIKTALQN